jgi:hypothetical protein
MVDADTDIADEPGTNGFSPVYTSFRTVENLIERMAQEGGVPARVDRSYLSNLPGSSQTILIASLKGLGLIDEQAQPSETLILMVERPDERSLLMNSLLRENYGRIVALSPNATQQQLEEAFREYGVTGSTLRKAVAFYLAAARFADLPVSPHFRTPKAAGGTRPRKPPRERKPQSGSGGGEGAGGSASDHGAAATDAKARYIDLLLKQASENPDDELYNRIEKVLGIGTPASQAPGQGDSQGGDSD